MVCFPYTFLIREFWKVPKKQGNSLPVLFFSCCLYPLLINLGCSKTTQALTCPRAVCVVEAPAPIMFVSLLDSHPTSTTTAATYQILVSPAVAFHCHQRGECTDVRMCN